ncbi:MAG TPA: HAD-IA family hydrolase [Puia sp.]|nr:HAD-IA family hydrolase [Puia sp.]
MPKTNSEIKTLFLDIGGVLLTNGWDHESRRLASQKFNLDLSEMEDRHDLTFSTYELGKLTLQEYLHRIIFYEKRSYTEKEFREFMFARSKAFPEMIELVVGLKKKYGLKIAVVSNEGRELNAYRIQKFQLAGFVDFFISSCFVHFRKPDIDIFKMALDISQVNASEVVYIEDQPMFVSIAERLGIKSIHHLNYETTATHLKTFGLIK